MDKPNFHCLASRWSWACLCLSALLLPALPACATSYQWTNTLGGDWSAITNWSPNGIPGTNDDANIIAPGSYTVTSSNNATFTRLTLGGDSGTQTLVYGLASACDLAGTVKNNGVLIVNNGGIRGNLRVEAGGQLELTSATYKQLYSFSLVNQGTVLWSGGSMSIGGSGGTTISNGGLWQITSDNAMSYGGGTTPVWVNSGILRKSGSSGTTSLVVINFMNQPGGLVDVLTGTLQITGSGTNALGGSFTATAPGMINLINSTWTDAGGTATGTGINQLSSGTLILRTNSIPGLKLAGGDVYTTSTFQQTGTITNLTLDGATLRGTNTVNNGTLTINNGSILEQLTIQSAGQLVFASNTSKLLYTATIINQGTVTWTGGFLNVGSTPPTVISNGGLWQIAGDLTLSYGGGIIPNWTNAGILRKTAGSGAALISGVNFVNHPEGLVDVLSGTLRFNGGNASQLGGTFNATAPGLIEITGGTWTDAGGVTTGTGTNRLNGGTFNFHTDTIPGLRLISGSVYITGTNTFQQSGAITNLTLDGVSLLGTNRIGNGTLTVNSGSVAGQLTVESNGQLLLATTASKTLYSLAIINQGTVTWTGGSLSVGSTAIANGGLWQIGGDLAVSYGGYAVPTWTNTGILQKSAGTGISSLVGINFYNQSTGLVQADTGTLQLPAGTTNTAGTLRLNGGKLLANGTLAFSGGTLDGAGLVGANALSGGIISPGQGGAGLLRFTSGLNLGSNATLIVDGTGIVPGTQYDQLSVTGAVVLSNCQLQVTTLPNVATGTTLVIIDNDGVDAVNGTFNGLPENAILPASGQLFRISYHGGTGNDVVLARINNTNALSTLSGVLRQGTEAVQFGATGLAGLTYTVLATTDLAATNWITVGSATADTLGNALFSDMEATNFPARFYRLVWP